MPENLLKSSIYISYKCLIKIILKSTGVWCNLRNLLLFNLKFIYSTYRYRMFAMEWSNIYLKIQFVVKSKLEA